MTEPRIIARAFRVTGRVQGVGFRAWTRGQARALGLAGWVRNAGDGSVTGVIEGPERAVEAMTDALFSGPGAAVVQHVEHHPAPVEGRDGFEVRR